MLLARAVSLSKVDSGSVPKIEREEFSWIGWFKKRKLVDGWGCYSRFYAKVELRTS